MKQILYVDSQDWPPMELPKNRRKLRIGDTFKFNGVLVEVWYIEDVGTTHRNIRVEPVDSPVK